MDIFEIWEDPEGQARFYFSHSDSEFTTGVLVLKPDAELGKHNRPLAFENLVQISGVCQMTLLDEAGSIEAVHDLAPGSFLRMKQGQWHIHANPYEEESVTLFKAEGDITQIVQTMRHKFTRIEPKTV